MEETIELRIGMPVIYVDQFSMPREALVTANFGGGNKGAVNVVCCSSDESKSDSYGRQIERYTSIPHKESQAAPGNYWCHLGEDLK